MSNTGTKTLWQMLYELYGPEGKDIVIHFKDVYRLRVAQNLQAKGFVCLIRETEFTFTVKRTLTNKQPKPVDSTIIFETMGLLK